MFYRFVFRNAETGETCAAVSFAGNSAARSLGLPFAPNPLVRSRQTLAEPWGPWECWSALGQCVWHYDAAGDCKDGARP